MNVLVQVAITMGLQKVNINESTVGSYSFLKAKLKKVKLSPRHYAMEE
jgi:hypothetical protein